MNRGLDAATGKYIGIVESDDWVDSNMFQELTDIAEKHNVDVVKSNFYRFTKDSEEINILPEHLSLNDLNKKIIPRKNTGIFFTQPSIWSAIYKREFLNNNNIRFLETPGASYQDTGFIFKVLVMSEQIWITDKTYLQIGFLYSGLRISASLNSASVGIRSFALKSLRKITNLS